MSVFLYLEKVTSSAVVFSKHLVDASNYPNKFLEVGFLKSSQNSWIIAVKEFTLMKFIG